MKLHDVLKSMEYVVRSKGYTLSPEEVEDIVQEAVCSVLRKQERTKEVYCADDEVYDVGMFIGSVTYMYRMYLNREVDPIRSKETSYSALCDDYGVAFADTTTSQHAHVQGFPIDSAPSMTAEDLEKAMDKALMVDSFRAFACSTSKQNPAPLTNELDKFLHEDPLDRNERNRLLSAVERFKKTRSRLNAHKVMR